MGKKLKEIFLFDTSSIRDLQSIRTRIIDDNRNFVVVWAIVEFFYGMLSLVLSFYVKRFMLCRDAYIAVMAVSAVAFFWTELLTWKKPLLVYFSMLMDYVALFGVSIMIARILFQNGFTGTIMVFASVLIAPVLFLSNTLLNIMVALLDIIVAAVFMRGVPAEIYEWCITDIIIFSSMGIVIGHFINKTRFERYVFAESVVKLAELQKKYAYYDSMTGLLNRRAYSEKIEEYEVQMPEDCCVIMVDVNGLKKMNDTHGHVAGDEIITGIADCLRGSFEGIDTIYRLGGDEFCIIANGMEEEIPELITKLKKTCAEWKGQYVSGISVSGGYATAKEFSDIDTLTRAADDRMYVLKKKYYESVNA